MFSKKYKSSHLESGNFDSEHGEHGEHREYVDDLIWSMEKVCEEYNQLRKLCGNNVNKILKEKRRKMEKLFTDWNDAFDKLSSTNHKSYN